MTTSPEEWRTIICSPNYAVSNLGRVKRLTDAPGTYAGKLLAMPADSAGYLHVNIRRDGRIKSTKVHVLVATAFHGDRPSPFHQVAHRDGKKDNNTAENLRWDRAIGNAADDVANGTRREGQRHGMAKITEEDAKTIRSEHACLINDLSQRYGVRPSSIRAIIGGSRWRHIYDKPPSLSALSND